MTNSRPDYAIQSPWLYKLWLKRQLIFLLTPNTNTFGQQPVVGCPCLPNSKPLLTSTLLVRTHHRARTSKLRLCLYVLHLR